MSTESDANDAETLKKGIEDSIEKLRDLTNEMRIVQEHESTILENEDRPKTQTGCEGTNEVQASA
jgi:hypothetical protein